MGLSSARRDSLKALRRALQDAYRDSVEQHRQRGSESAPVEAVETAEADPRAEGDAGEDSLAMPMLNKGGGRRSPNYEKASAEQIFNYLLDKFPGGEGHDALIEGMERRLEKERARIAKNEPDMRKIASDAKVSDPVEAYEKAHGKWEREMDRVVAQGKKWQQVKQLRLDWLKERGELAIEGKSAEELDRQMGDYLDMKDYVMRRLAAGRVKFRWKGSGEKNATRGLGEHLGLTNSLSERRNYFGWVGKDGAWPEEVAQSLREDAPNGWGERYDDMEFLDVVLDALSSYSRPMDMMRAAAEHRNEIARAERERWAAEEAAAEHGGEEAVGAGEPVARDELDDFFGEHPEAQFSLMGERGASALDASTGSRRMGMSDEQRRGSLAEETEDVPRSEQIVLRGNGVSMSEGDIENAISRAEQDAERMPEPIEFTKENWDKTFPAGKVNTPIGEVSLGAHQFE